MADPEEDLQILEALTALLCMLVDCTVDPWSLPEPTLEDVVTARANMQIYSYTHLGLLPGLSSAEREQGKADAQAIQALLEYSPGLLDASLEVDYLLMLDDLINDLSS